MSKVFISYRRDDTQDIAGRIFDFLEKRFGAGNIFKDLDSIPLGANFHKHLSDAIAKCEVVLVLIGPRWLTVTNPGGGMRRLDDTSDLVRIEVESALQRPIRVIPVIVGGGSHPTSAVLPEALKELANRQSIFVRPDPDFRPDMQRLIAGIEDIIRGPSYPDDDETENATGDLGLRKPSRPEQEIPKLTTSVQTNANQAHGDHAAVTAAKTDHVEEYLDDTMDPPWSHLDESECDPDSISHEAVASDLSPSQSHEGHSLSERVLFPLSLENARRNDQNKTLVFYTVIVIAAMAIVAAFVMTTGKTAMVIIGITTMLTAVWTLAFKAWTKRHRS